jgi:hypothetical protein
MDILKLFKSTDDGQYILLLEKLWLKQNHEDNDGYTPRPIPENRCKFVFIGKMQEYLSTDYNITSYVGQNLKVDTFKNKYDSINDVHLFHENYIEKIHFLNLLIKKLFNKSQQIVLNNYINEFMALKKKV